MKRLSGTAAQGVGALGYRLLAAKYLGAGEFSMSSKRHRLAARRAQRHRASASPPSVVQDNATSTEAAIERAYDRFAGYIRSATSFEDAASLARADLRTAVDEIAQLACGLDLITVISSVYVTMIINSVADGDEPWAALLELIALVLAWRDSSGSDTAPDRSQFMPPNVEAAAREAFAAGSMIQMFDTPPSNPEAAIVFHSVQREITLRNPVYPHMLLDTLRGLFDDATVNDDCRAVMGFCQRPSCGPRWWPVKSPHPSG
jgi:hypothetical protein